MTTVPVQDLSADVIYTLFAAMLDKPPICGCRLKWWENRLTLIQDSMCRPSMRHPSKEAREKAVEVCRYIHQAKSTIAILLRSCNHDSYNTQVLEKHIKHVLIETQDLCDLIGYHQFRGVFLCAGI